MRTLDASRWQIFRRVEAPTALPYAFSGAKIAVAVAVIGAVFGEWAGSSDGARPPDAAGQRPATMRSPVRRGRRSLGDGDRAVRRPGPARAARRPLAMNHPNRPPRARRHMHNESPASSAPPCSPWSRRWRSPPAARSPRTRRRSAESAQPDARLLPQPRPRRDLRRRSSSATSGTPASTSDRRRPATRRRRSSRSPPDRPTSRSPTSPRCCWHATRGLTWSRSAALVDEPLTSMIWLRDSGIGGIRDLRGRTVATAGIPYQDGLPEARSSPAPASTPARSRPSTSASACCPRSSAAAPMRCSAASATSRASTCACAARPRS